MIIKNHLIKSIYYIKKERK